MQEFERERERIEEKKLNAKSHLPVFGRWTALRNAQQDRTFVLGNRHKARMLYDAGRYDAAMFCATRVFLLLLLLLNMPNMPFNLFTESLTIIANFRR